MNFREHGTAGWGSGKSEKVSGCSKLPPETSREVFSFRANICPDPAFLSRARAHTHTNKPVIQQQFPLPTLACVEGGCILEF